MKSVGQAVHDGPCVVGLCTALLMQPQGLVSQHNGVSKAWAVLCTTVLSNLIVQ
ncbi:hypothetical protein IEO21_06058 [Rhodonia placenta]|uniref:Uncharacterized protein n=1 Tax=Rhodonia placenta TaxID=104341 RepID=A0A8H7P0T4_9APHY|nr:hypothetical protein IEO21_06058 [Postia placenta]